MFIKNFISARIYLTLVIIQKIQRFMMILIKNSLVKLLIGGAIIDQFMGLRSKMYSIKKINGSESSTTKGVNIATKFDKFKDVLFNKKVIKYKMKRIQAKKHKIGTYEIDKIFLQALMIKDMC